MTYSKISIGGYELEIQPSNYEDLYFDSREYKRAVDGSLVLISGVVKRGGRFSGMTESAQLGQLESLYNGNNELTFLDPRGNTYTVRIVKLERTYDDKVRATYNMEVSEV